MQKAADLWVRLLQRVWESQQRPPPHPHRTRLRWPFLASGAPAAPRPPHGRWRPLAGEGPAREGQEVPRGGGAGDRVTRNTMAVG